MTTPELEAQIKAEAVQIQNAPAIPLSQFQPSVTGQSGRCGWCGRISASLVLADVVNGLERYKGLDCCGGRHG